MTTTCLLCPSPAVADGLCVDDGAKKWAAWLWVERPREAIAYQQLAPALDRFPNHSKEAPERCKAILNSVRNESEAQAFLSKFDAARKARETEPVCPRGCKHHEEG